MRNRRVVLGIGALAVALAVGTPAAGAVDYPEVENNGSACSAVLSNPGTRPGGKSSRRAQVAGDITTALLMDACFGG